ncbi:hypothetical protein HpCK35_14780 [Helicobacter pylori]|uniref:Uncharacterized protein n=1 Tax=Campylobacter jejuni subsp. doylei (strain ATCC BAA-1458 / RM4099 / 269.97) TaxID=360109 RepID=A7H5B3_CAMJD|nr:hypothetical protein JJD26997_1719 [Campylobacter jejuni subsp. doylei 269.97]SQE23688.1 Uncharacterised protein [Campylobacter jejuni subsp. doylei]SUW98119.1 Uncharacterised protein [Campylobacter jejuni subsp. doylei]SUW99193.1 Uncharacterised protein [Campylobacter jejuni subsp. doylei]
MKEMYIITPTEKPSPKESTLKSSFLEKKAIEPIAVEKPAKRVNSIAIEIYSNVNCINILK